MNDWKVYQLVDATFPTGGFAHSFGLEAAVQQKWIQSREDLMRFLNALMHQTINMMLPLVYHGHRTLHPDEWIKIDEYAASVLTNHISARASLALGRAFVRSAWTMFKNNHNSDVESNLKRLMTIISISISISISSDSSGGGHHQEARPRSRRGHHAPIFGYVCRQLEISAEQTQRMFLYCTLRDVLSAATRLNVIGPMESSQLLQVLSSGAETMLQQGLNRPLTSIHQSAPLLDIVQGLQDQLYTRIFNT